MASQTTNYGLTKPDRSERIDVGVFNTNFDIIDTRMKLNQELAESASQTAPARGSISFGTTWSGSGPYTQTVTVSNATIVADSKVDLQPNSTALAQMISDGVTALWIENNGGTLTAYAMGAAPSAAMTMQCTVSSTKTTLASIEVTTDPTTTSYVVGNAVDYTGLVVTATYGDGSTAVVTDACELSIPNGTVLDSEGSKTVYVTYSYQGVQKITAFYLQVSAGLSKIEITDEPTKTSYDQGDELDLTGISVTATYSNLSTEDVTEDCTFEPADGTVLSEGGTVMVIASYTENGITKTAAFEVTVTETVLDRIVITVAPTTTSYTVGDALDLTGIVVTANYAGDVTNRCTFSPANGDTLDTAGTQTVTVAYSEDGVMKTATFDVTVEDDDE